MREGPRGRSPGSLKDDNVHCGVPHHRRPPVHPPHSVIVHRECTPQRYLITSRGRGSRDKERGGGRRRVVKLRCADVDRKKEDAEGRRGGGMGTGRKHTKRDEGGRRWRVGGVDRRHSGESRRRSGETWRRLCTLTLVNIFL